jgi:hypothetical protein
MRELKEITETKLIAKNRELIGVDEDGKRLELN